MLQTVTVTWNELDVGQAPLGGYVSFQLSAVEADSADGLEIHPEPARTYFFTNATGSSDPLVANDNASLVPAGSYYQVTVAIRGQQPYTFKTLISHSNGASQTLAYLYANQAQPAAQYAQFLPLPSGTPVAGQVPAVISDDSTATAWATPAGGTVTGVTGEDANGFTVSVADGSTTPQVEVGTSVTGLLKGNGTGVSAAAAGTDYLAPDGNGSALTGITPGQVGAASTGALSAEAATRASADTALSTAIGNEVSRAEGAESTLGTAIGAETTRAETAEGLLVPLAQKGANSGVATLDSGGHVPAGQLANALPTLAQASASASATLVVNTVTTVTAATALTMTLPTSVTGALIVVERESASAASVAVTGNIRGVAAQTVTLSLASESEGFLGAGGTWWPLFGHKTLGSLDSRYAPITEVIQAQRVTTTSDLSTQVLAASTPPAFTGILAAGPGDVIVDPDELYQPFLGAGAALTDSAAYVLWNYMNGTQRTALLTELFSPSQCAFSMVRIAFGSPDFRSEASVYTYDDMPSGQTDASLVNFSALRDTAFIIPALQQVMAINPGIRVVASAWTPPAWMLSSGTPGTRGEVLNATYNQAYANYLVAAVQAYQSYGIPVWALSVANEPISQTWLNMAPSQAAAVIGYLGPALAAAGLSTKILALDDDWGWSASDSETVLGDATAGQYTAGVAWHGYSGGPAAMSTVHAAYPSAVHVASEWRSLAAESAALQMQGWAGGYVAGSLRNWAQGIMGWNLCLDQNGNPNQGASGRIGIVTVNNSTGAVTRNAAYYALRQLAAFAKPGARRCLSSSFGAPYVAYTTYPSQVTTAALVNPDGSVVLYAYNGSGSSQTFQVIDRRTGQGFPVTMVSGELSTFTWGTSATLLPSAASSTPAAPGAPVLTATGGAGQVSLSWTVPSSAAPVDWYVIGRATSPGQEAALVTLPAGTTSYLDLAGASGTWYYTVTAVSAGGAGAAGTEKSATATSPAAPAAPVISAMSSGISVALSWTAPVPNGAVITSFNILRGTSSGTETSLGTASQGATGYTDSTGTPGTTYYYKVQAVNSAGTSASSNEVTGEATGVAFDATATDPNNTTVTTSITWNHTTGTGNHRILLAGVSYAGDAGGDIVQSVTYGGVSLAKLLTADPSPGGGTDKALDVWYLIAPASGTAAVVVTTQFTTSMSGVSVSYAGVSQSSSLRTPESYANTSSNSPSVATTGGAASDVVLAFLHARVSTTVTPGGSQSSLAGFLQGGSSNSYTAVTSQAGGTGTITSSFSWASADMAAEIAVALVAG